MRCNAMSCHVMPCHVCTGKVCTQNASQSKFIPVSRRPRHWVRVAPRWQWTCISHAFAVAASSHSPCKPPNNEPAKGEKKGWRETLKRGWDDGGLGLQSRGRVG
ncbi:hypothetical protein J3E69DRAFT_48902 [Trichoderma sp. SZMC 28015]